MSAVPKGVICTPDQYERSLNDKSIHCLTRGQSLGLTIVAETGFVSLLAVLFVFYIIFRNLVRLYKHAPRRQWRIIQQPMDVLMLSLFFADLLQALGAVLDVTWINEGFVEIGSVCTAQGIIQQLGETGVAMTTLIIAGYTFSVVWWGIGIGALLAVSIIMGLVWVFIILMVAIGNALYGGRGKLYQSPTPYWCWIGEDYLQFRIWGEYIWFWITLAVSLAAYILLFFCMRGNITRNSGSWWKFSVQRSSKGDPQGVLAMRRKSLTLLFYPIVYSVLILPLSVVRWITFVDEGKGISNRVPSGATIAVGAIYGLSGVCNVILLLTTRPNSVLFGKTVDYLTGRAPSPIRGYVSNNSVAEATAKDEEQTNFGRLPMR